MADLSVPIDHFAKLAKGLCSHVRAGDAVAVARVRYVFTDAASKTDEEIGADFGLMHAQHVIAVEHGFAGWKALIESSGIEARLAITMARYPDLNDFGIGLYQGHRRDPLEQQVAILKKDRETLRASAAAVAKVVTWLGENVEATPNINKRHTSYGIKHVAEQDIAYITNGVFIAAGIIAGYAHHIVPGSPNVLFGMSQKSLKDIATRRASPERILQRFMPRAIEILAMRGLHAYRYGFDLTWRDGEDVRTLHIGTIETTPFIVRISVDHFQVITSVRTANALSLAGFPIARPTRPKGEISVLLDEVDSALEWALGYDVRSGAPIAPPFDAAGFRDWSYLWSKRASDRSDARRKGAA